MADWKYRCLNPYCPCNPPPQNNSFSTSFQSVLGRNEGNETFIAHVTIRQKKEKPLVTDTNILQKDNKPHEIGTRETEIESSKNKKTDEQLIDDAVDALCKFFGVLKTADAEGFDQLCKNLEKNKFK